MKSSGVRSGDGGDSRAASLRESLEAEGKTVILVAIDRELMMLVALADQVKPEAAETISTLQAMGREVVMLTGDAQRTALAVAKEVGITAHCVVAGVLPSQKAEKVEEL